MALKKVKYTLPGETIDMGGIPLKQALPTQRVQQVDPFLLLHHGTIKPIYSRPAKVQGVGPHPHRGFSPVTFVIQGEVHHRDSRGNSQVASTGDIQWMHAGAGIIHSERPTDKVIEEKGHQEIIQLWINSPAAKKMIQPEYQYLVEADMVRVHSNDKKISSKLIAGSYGDKKSPINTLSELLIFWSDAQSEGEETFKIPAGFSSSIYSIKGDISVGGLGKVEAETLLVFDYEGDEINVKANSDAQFLLLSGMPIDEEVVQYGPFVMNTQTEILEAMRDYQMGKMGILIEE